MILFCSVLRTPKDCLSHNICGICRKRKHHDPKENKAFYLVQKVDSAIPMLNIDPVDHPIASTYTFRWI